MGAFYVRVAGQGRRLEYIYMMHIKYVIWDRSHLQALSLYPCMRCSIPLEDVDRYLRG
jgi:hypothetical protein